MSIRIGEKSPLKLVSIVVCKGKMNASIISIHERESKKEKDVYFFLKKLYGTFRVRCILIHPCLHFNRTIQINLHTVRNLSYSRTLESVNVLCLNSILQGVGYDARGRILYEWKEDLLADMENVLAFDS